MPILTVGPWAATGRTRPATPLAATSPPAVTWKNWRREVPMALFLPLGVGTGSPAGRPRVAGDTSGGGWIIRGEPRGCQSSARQW